MPSKRRYTSNNDPLYNMDQVVSATEATGLIPTIVPQNPDQTESATALYAVHSMEMKRKNRPKKKL